jgi:hypothetical protein
VPTRKKKKKAVVRGGDQTTVAENSIFMDFHGCWWKVRAENDRNCHQIWVVSIVGLGKDALGKRFSGKKVYEKMQWCIILLAKDALEKRFLKRRMLYQSIFPQTFLGKNASPKHLFSNRCCAKASFFTLFPRNCFSKASFPKNIL